MDAHLSEEERVVGRNGTVVSVGTVYDGNAFDFSFFCHQFQVPVNGTQGNSGTDFFGLPIDLFSRHVGRRCK